MAKTFEITYYRESHDEFFPMGKVSASSPEECMRVLREILDTNPDVDAWDDVAKEVA